MGNEMTGQAPIIFPQEKGSTSAVFFFGGIVVGLDANARDGR